MRRYFLAAMTATTTLAFGAVAVAQAPEATQQVTVSPAKAGTKKKPKSEKLHLTVTNNNTQRTASMLTIAHAKTIVLSGKGFPTCSQATLEQEGAAACPAKSRVGGGTAKALLGVNTSAPQQLNFKVTAFVGGAKGINFYLEGVELPGLKLVAPGAIKGNKLVVSIPLQAQQPVQGTWAGLQTLDTTISGKIKKHAVVTSVGCKHKKHAFETTITFVNNGVQPGGTAKAVGAARCK